MTSAKAMTGLPQSAEDSPVPPIGVSARPGRVRSLWDAVRALWRPEAGSRRRREVELARILDLFEEYVYAGEITPDGRYVHHASMSTDRGPDRRFRPAGCRRWTLLGVAHRARGLGAVRGLQPLPAGRRGRRGDVSRGRPGRRHAGSARSRTPASPGRRQRPRRGHRLRHHRARRDRRPPRRGQRPLHQPPRRGRRARLPRARDRRPDAGVVPGPRWRPAAGRGRTRP